MYLMSEQQSILLSMVTSWSTQHCSGCYETRRNPTHQCGLDPCRTCASRSTLASRSPCTSHSTRSWSCLNSKRVLDSKSADVTHFAGSRALCWPVTMHLAPSNLVASLAPNLQWGEEVHPQKCRGTVSLCLLFCDENFLDPPVDEPVPAPDPRP